MGILQAFLNPWLLGGLALAAAPLIIHFLNKRRFIVEEWAAMDFLFQAAIINRRRVKLEDLILLLLRMLLIILLVLAVARPLIQGLGDWQEDQRLVILDDSFSMDHQTPTGSIFDLARESAVNQVQDAVGRGLPVDVRLGSRPTEVGLRVAGRLGEDAESPALEDGDTSAHAARSFELLESIREIEPADQPLQLARILERVAEEVDTEDASHRRSVILITDLRRVDWHEGESEQLRPALRAVLEKIRDRNLAERLGLQLLDLGRPASDNVTLTDVKVTSRHPTTGVPLRVQVEVANFGASPSIPLEGSIEIAPASPGPFQATRRLPLPTIREIPPGERVTVEVEIRFPEAGIRLLRATVGDDSLPRDNEGFAVIQVREGLEALLVDGDPRPGRFAGEADYLLAALSPRGSLPSGIRARKTAGPIRAEDLEGLDVLFLLNRESLSDGERELVEDFVESGGGLAYFLGNRVSDPAYGSLALPSSPEAESSSTNPESPRILFPATLGGELREIRRVPLTPVSLEHPAFAIFGGLEGTPLGRRLFQTYRDLRPVEGASVVAHYADEAKTPGIIESRFGEGRVVIFNTTADRDASDWPTDPSFVIVLQEWVRHLAPARDAHLNLEVGEPLRWKTRPGFRHVVVDPRGERHPIDTGADPGTVRRELSFENTTLAGFYRLEKSWPQGTVRSTAETQREVIWFACQRPESESNLARGSPEKLRGILEDHGLKVAVGREIQADAFAREQEGELWRWLALAAGAILLLELFLAWFFGRK